MPPDTFDLTHFPSKLSAAPDASELTHFPSKLSAARLGFSPTKEASALMASTHLLEKHKLQGGQHAMGKGQVEFQPLSFCLACLLLSGGGGLGGRGGVGWAAGSRSPSETSASGKVEVSLEL